MGREFVHHLPISLYFSEDLAEISLENIKSRVLSYKDPQSQLRSGLPRGGGLESYWAFPKRIGAPFEKVEFLLFTNRQELTFKTCPKSYPLISETQPCILFEFFFPLEMNKGLFHGTYNTN
jgi:hypothetical protein